MTFTHRRTVLTALATAAVSGPLLGSLTATPAHATGDLDIYTSNTDLYKKLAGKEGVEFARRYKRHEYVDHSTPQSYPYNRTTVMALHGGGIETGTSELCLGIAGYHPATFAPLQDGHGVHDYWMFEGLRTSGNRDLHVTAKNCDDHVALSMAFSSLNVLSLHGCTSAQAGTVPQAVVVGGLNTGSRPCSRRSSTRWASPGGTGTRRPTWPGSTPTTRSTAPCCPRAVSWS